MLKKKGGKKAADVDTHADEAEEVTIERVPPRAPHEQASELVFKADGSTRASDSGQPLAVGPWIDMLVRHLAANGTDVLRVCFVRPDGKKARVSAIDDKAVTWEVLD